MSHAFLRELIIKSQSSNSNLETKIFWFFSFKQDWKKDIYPKELAYPTSKVYPSPNIICNEML